jgi:hypothetical protein
MYLKPLKGIFLFLIPLILVLQSFFSCAHPAETDSLTKIERIEIEVKGIQREKTSFSIINKTEGKAHWLWEIVDAEDGDVVEASTRKDPTFSLSAGIYDLRLIASGKNTLVRHYRRCITVLPKTFNERQADEVIDLSEIHEETLVKDYVNKKRPGYKILIKGTFNGRIKITGLRGTRKHPVHIINKGQVEINSVNENSPYAWQFSDDNQYILLDGKADPKIPYGFIVRGHPSKSGQVLFIAGQYNRGFEVCGANIIGQQGITQGAAAIQLQTSYTQECNADNWNFEYFRFHHNKIERASSEGMYIGYFTDEKRDTGFTPFRLGSVLIFRDTIINSGWDAIQIASADQFEVHDNYVDGASISGKRSHSSFISWNSGNKTGWCYRNTFRNCAHGASVIFGESGKDAFIYSNLFIEGKFPSTITTPAFFFSKVNNSTEDVGLYIFHNTILTSRISAKVDYKNDKSAGIPVLFAANAILQNRVNLKKYPEIAMGSDLKDSVSWTIQNVWRMQDEEKELRWDSQYRPKANSPLLNVDFDIKKHIPKLMGGFYDRDGYPLKHETAGYTAGCFSAYQISKDPKTESNGID